MVRSFEAWGLVGKIGGVTLVRGPINKDPTI